MLQALRRSVSSSSQLAEAKSTGQGWTVERGDALEEEVGLWRYLVVDPNGIKPREETRYAGGRKVQGSRVQEGQIVEVDRRRRSGWTRWLMLKSGDGWIFDVSPKDTKVRAVEVEVLNGPWQYQVCVDRVAVLPRPSQSQDAKFRATYLSKGEIVNISSRIRMLNSKGAYLSLEDGRGFSLDFVGGVQVLQRLPEPGTVAVDCTAPTEHYQHVQQQNPTAYTYQGAADPSKSYMASQAGQGLQQAQAGGGSGDGGYCGGPTACCGYGGAVNAFAAPAAPSFPSWSADPQSGLKSPQGSAQPTPTMQRSPSLGSLATTTCSTLSPPNGSRNNAVAVDLGAPEHGEWTYMVLDPGGVTLRGSPTYDNRAKVKDRVKRGDIVKVVERRLGHGTTFVRLESPKKGWAFDTQPGNILRGQRMRLFEVAVEGGSWHYRIVAPHGVAIRSRCSFDESAKAGQGPAEGEIVTVVERLKVAAVTFLKIAAEAGRESGWIFDQKDGRTTVEGPITLKTFPDETYGFVQCAAPGVHLSKAPTLANWAQTSYLVLQGAKVQLKEAVDSQTGTDTDIIMQWYRIVKPGGVEGWLPQMALDIEQKQAISRHTSPASPTGAAPRGFSSEQVRQALHAPNPLTLGSPSHYLTMEQRAAGDTF